MSGRATLERLSPRDFYRQLDWVRDEWGGDEYKMAQKLTRLRRTYEQLPSRYYERAVVELAIVSRARVVNGVPWQLALRQLADIVGDWDRCRPPQLDCEVCGIAVRGHPALANHYEIVHPEHAVPAVPSE
jgi:hypothetical protein